MLVVLGLLGDRGAVVATHRRHHLPGLAVPDQRHRRAGHHLLARATPRASGGRCSRRCSPSPPASCLLGWPISGAVSLTLLLIVFFMIEGVLSIMYAFEHKKELSGRWGWMLVSGIVDLILAAIILAGLPGTAAWALGLLVGINMLFGGTVDDRDGAACAQRGERADAAPGRQRIQGNRHQRKQTRAEGLKRASALERLTCRPRPPRSARRARRAAPAGRRSPSSPDRDERPRQRADRARYARPHQRLERLRDPAALDQPGGKSGKAALARQARRPPRRKRAARPRASPHRRRQNVRTEANPRSLVGDGGAQRETLGPARPSLQPSMRTETAVTREIGRGRDIDLLGAERARLAFDRGDDPAETGCRASSARASACCAIDAAFAASAISAGSAAPRSRANMAVASRTGEARAAGAQIVERCRRTGRRDRRCRPRHRPLPPPIMRAASSPMRGAWITSATRLVRSIQLFTR